MIVKICKISLVFSVALYLFLVVLNNLTDFHSNYLFVENVLGMTTVFEGNKLQWRAMESPMMHLIFYICIIIWETVACVLCFLGGWKMCKAISAPRYLFERSKSIALAGLTLNLLLWFLAFITVGGEWFTMWQSEIWNGQDAAFRMFGCTGIILLFVYLAEPKVSKPIQA